MVVRPALGRSRSRDGTRDAVTRDERFIRDALTQLTSKGASHLKLAVHAAQLADAADRVARVEVMEARADGATWADVGDAFGVTTQTAHERFRSGPDGLHSRYEGRAQSKSDGATSDSGVGVGSESRTLKAARTKATDRS